VLPSLFLRALVEKHALAWWIGGSKADFLELKVAVVTSGLESEVHCIPQQMHEFRPFPVPGRHKVPQNRFFAWCEVGSCRARCCALSLAPWHWHQGPAMMGIGRVDST
jgi:hypothetical protein